MTASESAASSTAPAAARERLLRLLDLVDVPRDGSASAWRLLHPARWLLLVALCCVSLLWLWGSLRPLPAPALVTLASAVMARADANGLPDAGAARAVTLPDLWDRNPRDAVPTWYRLSFDRPAPAQTVLAAYLEQVCASYEVRLNGLLIAWRGDPRDPRAGQCMEPALITLPPPALRDQANVLDIRLSGLALRQVAARERAGMLAPVVIGLQGPLEAHLARARALQTTLPLALAAVCAAMGVAALGLAVLARLPYLGYFGAACLGWAVLSALLLGVELPLPMPWDDRLIGALAPPVAVATVLFLMRYCGLRVEWIESSLALQCVFVLLGLALAAPERVYTVTQPWALILVLEIVVALGVFLRRAWSLSRTDFWLAALAAGCALLVLALEFAVAEGPTLLPGKLAIGAGAIVMFGGMVWRLLRINQAALQAAEMARLAAEKKVQDINADMEQNYDRMAELRIEQVTAKERKRIAADLHDDLGAKLLTIVHTSDNERIATLGREALEEMRLSVRGLTGRAVQLGDAIGDWRSEVMMRLSQGGVDLAWDAPDELLMSERAMSARAYVQTTRILREAVSNVLKHSGASHCEITVRQHDNDFELTIKDNGKGIPTELDGKLDRGHGMSTMKGRAKQLQGQCLVESGPGYGTTIRLTMPL